MLLFSILALSVLIWMSSKFLPPLPRGTLNCGLFGYSGSKPVDVIRLAWLASENQKRGDDSTGVYGNHLYKDAVSSKLFIQTEEFRAAVEGATNIVGHTRKSTVGKTNQENAHPFVLEYKKTKKTVVGTHNGQLFQSSFEDVCKKYKLTPPNVDSMLIYEMMLRHEFDYDKTLSELDGMMALAFIRPEYKDVLYLYRRPNRPLHVGFIDDSLYYSSEEEPLNLIGCSSTDELAPDMLYTFKKGGLVGVNPVKKSNILVLEPDISMQGYLQKKNFAHGAFGAGVQKGNVIVYGPQGRTESTETKQQPRMTMTPTNACGGSKDKETKQINLFTTENSNLYRTNESVLTANLGRYLDSGDYRSGYVFLQLLSNYGDEIGLPAWSVTVPNYPDLTSLSTHSGLVALKIPEELCDKPLRLKIFNPLNTKLVFDVSITKPVIGRVLEVALFIPFQGTKEKEEESISGEAEQLPIRRDGLQTQETLTRIHLIPKIEDLFSNPKQVFESTDVTTEHVQNSFEKENTASHVRFDRKKSTSERVGGSETESVGIGGYVFGSSSHGGLNSEYDNDTDILTMDYYTTLCTKSDLEGHITKNDALLSSPIPDDRDLMERLAEMNNYLEWLHAYFESRVKALANYEGVEDKV